MNNPCQQAGVVHPGETVLPPETDRSTYVIVQLENGSRTRLDIRIVDDRHPYINSRPQENLFDIVYAE